MDGTLIDTMGYWRDTTLSRLSALGYAIPEKYRGREKDISGHELVEACFGSKPDTQALERFFHECEQSMIEQYPSIPEKPGALAFLHRAREQGFRMCVATASPMENALAALDARGMLPLFEFVTTTHELGQSKRFGAFFVRVAEMLGLGPSDCLMFEDALYAIRAAKAAGMDVYAIADASMRTDESMIRALSNRFFTDYAELMGEL